MANQLGPIEFNCNAPSYTIVRACGRVGIDNPEDVPWYRFGQFVNGQTGRKAAAGYKDLLSLLLLHRPRRTQCLCGQPLPELALCTFVLASGSQQTYLIGQCGRCHTVYWDQPFGSPEG
jgi:hypothetical protein